jgi:phospholipid/cholesterol/gamma-HCH transport system substrate-binding protein
MSRNAVETVMGAVVLVVAAVFLFFAYTTTQVQAVSGYDLTARFDRVDGVRQGTDVKISGIKVGSVATATLDPKTFLATLRLSIASDIKLPKDTVASIKSAGLLGDNFVALDPGNEDAMIPPGGTIEHTQSPIDLMGLIGQFIFGQTGQSGPKKEGGNAPEQPK